jgi:hypothetical protein
MGVELDGMALPPPPPPPPHEVRATSESPMTAR